MLDTALLPLRGREPAGRVDEILDFLAERGSTSVVLLSVTGGGTSHRKRTEGRLDAVAVRARERGLEPRVLVRSGSTATEIVAVSGEEDVGVITIMWKRKTWLQRSVLGSVTADVVRLSDIPVLVLKHQWVEPAEPREMTVLYATDFQATDADISPYLRSPGLSAPRLHLFHAGRRAPDPEAERRRRGTAQEALSRLAREFAGNFGQVDVSQAVGNPRRRIVREARQVGASLIVVGKADAPRGLQAVLGSTAEELPHSAGCSVLIIPRR
ncbi:MAG: universal stress protein [Spirochaetaceae bacterium]